MEHSLHQILLNRGLLIFGRIESCALAAIPEVRLWWMQDADQLQADAGMHCKDFAMGLSRAGKGCAQSRWPVAALRSPSMGADVWTGPLYYTRCTGLNANGVCQHHVSNRGSTPCCMQVRSCTSSMCPMGKAFSFFFFPPLFLAHFTDLEFNLQTLSRSQLFLLRCGAYR